MGPLNLCEHTRNLVWAYSLIIPSLSTDTTTQYLTLAVTHSHQELRQTFKWPYQEWNSWSTNPHLHNITTLPSTLTCSLGNRNWLYLKGLLSSMNQLVSF